MTIIRWPGKHGFCICMLLLSLLSSASAQEPGFISIDCGATSDSTDPTTGIQWTTDAAYTSTGTNQIIDRNIVSSVNQDQVQTLRHFPPDRNKHCYILPVTGNTTYLIRAVFAHGGFQSAVDNNFNITIDSNFIDYAAFTDSLIDSAFAVEYVVGTDLTSDTISFCLVPVGTSAFINTLELRPFARGMYDIDYRTKYLKYLIRLNNGAAASDPNIRYPDDVYDRIWYSPGDDLQLTSARTTRNIPSADALDNPPLPVLQSAWFDPKAFWWGFTPPSEELNITTTFYVNLFFAEVQTVKATDVRSFSVALNGEINYPNLTLGTGAQQLFSKSLSISSTGANFSFEILPGATLGPVLNAGEYYSVRDWIDSSTDSRDVTALGLLKKSLGLTSWAGDPCLPVPHNWITCDKGAVPRITAIKLSNYSLTGTIPSSVGDLTALTDLWLDNNRIQGAIPDLSKLTKLKTLHLQNNFMSGGIPSTLASLPLLTELFLQKNKFSGPIPAGLASKNGLNLQTSGNSKLCGPTETCPILPVEITNNTDTNSRDGEGKSKSGGSGAVIGGIVGGVIAAIIVIGLLAWFFCRKPRKQLPPDTGSIASTAPHPTGTSIASAASARPRTGGPSGSQARAFTLYEVEVATNNRRKKIGEGGFGPVYYGKLPDGTEVAVKVNSETSNQGTTEFSNEVSTLSRVHHKNLVSLLGYCQENKQQILIYEFMSKGTLREHLYGRDMKGRIGWKERLDIALNAAKGLEYLHNDCIPKIIHRDIKSNNILLNDKLLAKVADFGISKLTPEGDSVSGVSTLVRGTTGYLDPEYYNHNKLTQKSDVYSFGVVLLELICGRPPNTRDYNLVDWARGQLNSNDLESIIDPFIKGTYNLESLWKVAELAMYCVEPYGINRPDMNQVVRALGQAVEFEEQKTETFSSSHPWAPSAPAAGTHGNYNDSSYTHTSTSDSNPAPLFTPPQTGKFRRQASDTRDSNDQFSELQPR
ncbi:hypothetical protein R1sor_002172 [Riccia sorocarpa]|uniref:non-specific serine/threonine protein kinase n=1 Tax=Riccia sorocarpa TaxID=122646 RepID=A0ABD3GY16_9MARC